MARRGLLAATVVLGLGLLLGSTQAFERTEWTAFRSLAFAVCTPLPSCALPQRGIITCPGGTEISSGPFAPWCSPDSRTKVRGRMLKYGIVESTDPRVAGEVTMLFNMNLDSSTFTGPFWGSYSIEVPGHGAWEGTLEGKAHSGAFWTYKVVLFGGGELEGFRIRANGEWRAGQGDRLDGRIVDPSN